MEATKKVREKLKTGKIHQLPYQDNEFANRNYETCMRLSLLYCLQFFVLFQEGNIE